VLFRSVLLPTLVAPLATASAALLVLTLGLAERIGDRGRAATTAAVGFLAGSVALTGWPRWPPVEAMQRLFFVVALAAALAWFIDTGRRTLSLAVLRGVLTALQLVLLLQAPMQHSWSRGESAAWLAGLFLLGLGMHWSWGSSLAREGDRPDRLAGVVRILLLCGIAALLGMSGSARLAQLAGALTCGAGVVEVGSRVLGRRPWSGGAALVLVTAALGLLLAGYFYAELATWPAILAVLSCLLLGVPLGRSPASRLLALAPLALAVGLAAHTLANEPEDPYARLFAAGDYGADRAVEEIEQRERRFQSPPPVRRRNSGRSRRRASDSSPASAAAGMPLSIASPA
jgi:hypothetical protein